MQNTRWQQLAQWQEGVWLMIALLTPLFINLWVEQQFEASKVWLLRLLVLLLAGLFIWQRTTLPAPNNARPLSQLLLLMALAPVATLLLTMETPRHDLFGSLERANGTLTQSALFLLFLIVAAQIDREQSERLLQTLILTTLPICLLGLAQATGWQPLAFWSDASTPLATTLGRSNFTGAYLALIVPLTLLAALGGFGRAAQRPYAALLVLQLGVIALTQARAAWLATVVGVAVLLWLLRAPGWSARTRWLTALAGVTVGGGGLAAWLYAGIAAGGSIAARWTIWRAVLLLIWRNPTGYGADTLDRFFPAVYPPQLVYYQGRDVIVDRAHNWLLDWAFSYGVFMLVVYGLGIGWVLWCGWRVVREHGEITKIEGIGEIMERRWVAACMAGAAAYLVGNLVLFEVAATAVVFWLLLAMVAAATVQDKRTVRVPTLPPRWRPLLLLALLTGGGWLAWHGSIQPLRADAAAWRATQAYGRGDLAAARVGYNDAHYYQPQQAAYISAAALVAAEQGYPRSAADELQAAIALWPTDPTLYYQLAGIYARMDDRQADTLAAYNRAIALAPTLATGYRLAADYALRSGALAVAEARAQQAVTLDATDGVSFGILGWTRLAQGDAAEAHAAFTHAVRWAPDSADFYVGLATAQYQQGALDAARAALAQALARDRVYPPALALQTRLNNP